METQISSELELNILNDLKIKLPGRRVVLEVGEKFGERESILEKLRPYGEVHLENHKQGRLYDDQFKLFGLFQQTRLNRILAPLDPKLYRQIFNLDKDSHITITLLENETVVGTVQLSFAKNLRNIISEYELIHEKSKWTEQQQSDGDRYETCCKEIAMSAASSASSMDDLILGRTLIVHPEHRRKGLAAHLKLIQLMVGWLLSEEHSDMTHSVSAVSLTEKLGAEKVAEADITEFLHPIPEERKPEFTTTVRIYVYKYQHRKDYYHNCLSMITRL